MDYKSIIGPELWKEVVTDAEKTNKYVMSSEIGHSFGIFTKRDQISDYYKQTVSETPCFECKKVISVAYVQWKRNDWRYICTECFQ